MGDEIIAGLVTATPVAPLRFAPSGHRRSLQSSPDTKAWLGGSVFWAAASSVTATAKRKLMANITAQAAGDWAGRNRTRILIWWLPQCAVIAGLVVDVPVRTAIWSAALAWMGTACLLNARRCGRTHCRFTGPFYLATVIPVLALGLGIVSYGIESWVVLGVFILVGGKLIWWASERAWGKFS